MALGRRKVSLAAVPKAAIDEDTQLRLPKDYVGLAPYPGLGSCLPLEAKTSPSERPSQETLSSRLSPDVGLHHFAHDR